MSLLAVGISHQTAPVSLLEQFAMTADDVAKALHELVSSDHVSEAIVLATCNRVEVFAEVERFHGGVTDISRVLARQAGATVEELSPYVTVHYEDQAVTRLFTVTAGLDSMVVGETQVLGQLRNAYAQARIEGTVGRALHPVAQHALRVGKRVHAETGIDRAGASLVSVSLDTAEQRLGALAGRPALVVGAGSMGALAAATLSRRGAMVTVASRTSESAARLAAAVDGATADLDDLTAAIAAADFLVTCTGATGTVIGVETVSAAMAARPGRPLAVIDLALPRDVELEVAGLPGVHVVDLALLQGVTSLQGGADRDGDVLLPADGAGHRSLVAADDIAAAHALIEAEAALLRAERLAEAVAPTVSALRSQAAEVVDAELLRLSSRVPDLDARARAEVARTVRRVVDKLLHEPTVRVKELASAPGGVDYADALRALFGLGIDSEVPVGRDRLADAVTVDPDDMHPGGGS